MSGVRDQDSAIGFTDPIAALRSALKGRYEIERQIGQGAFATVYLARDLKHERKVAIKVLNADPESETGEIRFIREIRVVARLQHPNILPLHDSGHVEALLYYVMPYVMGETLRIRMHRERQMGVEAACAIARETSDALAYAHSQGIVHRDIKPENILLSGGHAIVADFGIARAIDVGGVRQLTMTGVAGPGTPAYMSPEQLLGDRAVDARSDIYSLGCVLYEMLAGKPPFPGKDGFVKRFTEPPPHISSLRRDSPPWLDPVIAKALAKDPADRYPTAADFVGALSSPVTPVRVPRRESFSRNALASPPMFESDPLEAEEFAAAFPTPERNIRPTGSQDHPNLPFGERVKQRLRARPAMLGFAALSLAGLVMAAAAASRSGSFPTFFGERTEVDSTRLVVLASATGHAGGNSAASMVADSLYDAFTSWEGLPMVPATRVAQAIASGAAPPTTEESALELARQLGAGTAIWIQASGPSEAPRIRVHRYHVESSETRDEFGMPTSQRDGTVYATAAQRLLGMRDRPNSAAGCDHRTRSFQAWSACSRGHMALASGNIATAERNFREAIGFDATYGPALLWRVQLLTWRSPSLRGESYHLARGAGGFVDLSTRDSLIAAGLTAFVEQRYPAACAAYRELTRADSADFAGWYGLGECQSADSTVIKSATSESGWAFRSSWHSAVKAYRHALRIQPGAYEIFSAAKLQALMPVSPTITRIGFGIPPGRQRFAAFPTAEPGDTIGFVPYPTATFARIERTSAADAALRKNRNLLSSFAEDWAQRFPLSASAQEARADALEAHPDLGGESPHSSVILNAIDSAIKLSTRGAGGDAVRLRARKVRIHFKRGEFASARVLADSILRTPPLPGTEMHLSWVAGLTGRANLAARYWERTFKSHTLTGETVPPAIASPASRYFAYAAAGICGAQLGRIGEQLDSAFRNYVTGDIRDAVRSDLYDRAALLAAPCTNGRSALGTAVTQDRLRLAQQAFARGEFARTRELLAAGQASRRGRRPGDTSMEYLFRDAWLRTQVADTAGAERALDAALTSLPTFGAAAFTDLAGAASFGRAMALRAELAAKRGDARTARRWASALSELWASADAPLRATPTDLIRLLPANGGVR